MQEVFGSGLDWGRTDMQMMPLVSVLALEVSMRLPTEARFRNDFDNDVRACPGAIGHFTPNYLGLSASRARPAQREIDSTSRLVRCSSAPQARATRNAMHHAARIVTNELFSTLPRQRHTQAG